MDLDALKTLLIQLPGGSQVFDKLQAAINAAIDKIKSEAKKGAEDAIPRIKAEVTKTVTPLVTASMLMGLGGLLLGLAAYRSRNTRALSGARRRLR